MFLGPKKTLVDIAYEKIFQDIITFKFKPGMRLEEKTLMDIFEIGRTPIREALMRLETAMIVESQSGKGFIVKPVTLQSTKSTFETLLILENGVVDLAMKRNLEPYLEPMVQANIEIEEAAELFDVLKMVEKNHLFHERYAACSENEYLIHGLIAVRCEARRLAFLSYGESIDDQKSLKKHYKNVISEHNEMIKYLGNKDADSLKKVIKNHIQAFKGRVINYLME
jgi:DNA-binding GntR family transcriptional regulator